MTDSLTAEQVDTLLNALGSDDAFRELFVRDAAAAIEKLGLPGAFAQCCSTARVLASKETIAATRKVLESQLLGKLAHNVHSLDAG